MVPAYFMRYFDFFLHRIALSWIFLDISMLIFSLLSLAEAQNGKDACTVKPGFKPVPSRFILYLLLFFCTTWARKQRKIKIKLWRSLFESGFYRTSIFTKYLIFVCYALYCGILLELIQDVAELLSSSKIFIDFC